MVVADLDLSLITKRKRMMDSVGHYSRPELLSLLIDRGAKETSVSRAVPGFDAVTQELRAAAPLGNALAAAPVEERLDAGR
jgi:aliphatic nitrilase